MCSKRGGVKNYFKILVFVLFKKKNFDKLNLKIEI